MPDEAEIIAERAFYLEGDPTERPVVVLRLLRPVRVPENYPKGRYELIVNGQVQKREVPAVDELHCIMLCLSAAGTQIAGLNQSVFSGKLRWHDGANGGQELGLPTIEDSWPTNSVYREALQWSIGQQREAPRI